ncbi:DUF2778 domain-containing protein [Rhizobium sp. GN54]|uniref:DUF2778 domain-containing protein n=1 Tax=Rhizobium sp. GN54 TaxID=2898150 RepID=UPI001E4EA396|nr:DUF2778 domain-containing protein [Rhizobium sp. GN54]MCD2181810.1 DUF2778 domain-containing protein [Rhizobium sp. GN54]
MLFGAFAACLSVAAGAWVSGALATVQATASPAAAAKQGRLQASLDMPKLAQKAPVERNIRIKKFSRLSKTPADQLWPAGLTVAVIKDHYDRRAVLAAAKIERETARKAQAYALAASSRAEASTTTGTVAAANVAVQPTLVSALVDPGAARPSLDKPFNLVLPEEAAELGLPDTIPLPEARPKRLAKVDDAETDRKAAKPAAARELAYASPSQLKDDDEVREKRPGLFGSFGRKARGRTAYYDISAGIVHLPNGERLEAHSGIGKMRDNPRYAHMKMRGPTPPGTFKLTMREKRFHGVEALRMTSVDGRHPLGRTGLLTHSYLLGPNGNSHGCVAFRNYPRFLAAFKRGEIDTLVVVPSIGSSKLASLFGRRI